MVLANALTAATTAAMVTDFDSAMCDLLFLFAPSILTRTEGSGERIKV
jgi:hypothetical protein